MSDQLSKSRRRNPVGQFGKAGPRHSGHEPQGVLVIELSQHRVRQVDAVQLPERVVVAVIVEVFVAGLEHAPVVRVFVRLIAVFSEQHPVLVLHEEVVRRARLAAEVVEHGADFAVHVRHLVEHLRRRGPGRSRAIRGAP